MKYLCLESKLKSPFLQVNFADGVNSTKLMSSHITVENERDFVSCDSKKLTFRPFSDNRMGFEIKRRNEKNPFPKGTISIVISGTEKVVLEEKLDLNQFM